MKKLQKQTRKEDSNVCSYGYDIWSGDGELLFTVPGDIRFLTDEEKDFPFKYLGCWVESFD